MPLVVIVALLLGGLLRGSKPGPSNSNGRLPPVTVSPPPSDAATLRPCASVIDALPLRLGSLPVRPAVSNPGSSEIVAWGDPPVVLRCGVARPTGFTRTSQLIAVDGVNLLPKKASDATVFTVVDRPVYIEITVPTAYSQPPLGPIAAVIANKLNQVCTANQAGQATVPAKDLCVNRH